jgi:hypothetical protein
MGKITLKVKTDGEAGKKISQKATVYTDDPDNAKIELIITGEVLAAADINPKVVRLVGQAGDPLEVIVTITPPDINQFDITGVKAQDGSNIEFKLQKKDESGSQRFMLHVANLKPDPGRYFDKIILTTNSTRSPEIAVRVFGIIREK